MKLLCTRDGVFEFAESVPTQEQRDIGNKVLLSRLKDGSKAANFLKVDLVKSKSRPEANLLIRDEIDVNR